MRKLARTMTAAVASFCPPFGHYDHHNYIDRLCVFIGRSCGLSAGPTAPILLRETSTMARWCPMPTRGSAAIALLNEGTWQVSEHHLSCNSRPVHQRPSAPTPAQFGSFVVEETESCRVPHRDHLLRLVPGGLRARLCGRHPPPVSGPHPLWLTGGERSQVRCGR